jgi:hypothetical protein
LNDAKRFALEAIVLALRVNISGVPSKSLDSFKNDCSILGDSLDCFDIYPEDITSPPLDAVELISYSPILLVPTSTQDAPVSVGFNTISHKISVLLVESKVV